MDLPWVTGVPTGGIEVYPFYTTATPPGVEPFLVATPERDYRDGNWHFAAVTYDGNWLKFYVDGSLMGSTFWAQPSGIEYYWPGGLAIGRDGNGDRGYFPGDIDDVRIYNRALAPAEIGYLSNGGAPAVSGQLAYTVPPGTNGFWILDTIVPTNSLFTALTNGYEVHGPVWSPDGQWVVFDANWDSMPGAQIYAAHPDGTGARRVSRGNDCVDPDISPDGARIAYEEVGGDCFIINLDGTGLTDTGFRLGQPKWTPDGDHILADNWALSSDPYHSDLFIYDLKAKTTSQITFHRSGEAFSWPAESPDGRKIVCAHSLNDSTSPQICVINSDGSNPVDVTSDWTSVQGVPIWLPDGRYILFQSNHDGDYDIWAMWPDGSWRTNLTQGSGSHEKFSFRLLPPAILLQPLSQDSVAGGSVAFSVSATGSAPLNFQWQFNGASIPGATTSALALTGLSSAQTGIYQVLVSNSSGSVTSAPAVLSLLSVRMYAGLTIIGPTNLTYQIQAKNNLNDASWLMLTNVVLNASPYLWFDLDSPAYPKRFYRAVPQP